MKPGNETCGNALHIRAGVCSNIAMTDTSQYTCDVAIVGVGRAIAADDPYSAGQQSGYRHARIIQQNPRLRLAAAADVHAENLAAFGAVFATDQLYADHRQMFQSVKPKIVCIATPAGGHRQIIEDAAEAGVQGIFCETPLLNSPSETKPLQRIAGQMGVKIVTAYVRRHLPVCRRAAELYQSGAVGEPVMVFAGIENGDMGEAGGAMIDLIRMFHGDRGMTRAYGQMHVGRTRQYGHAVEDAGMAHYEFDGGGRAVFETGHRPNGQASVVLVGSAGTIRIEHETLLVLENAQGKQEENFADHPMTFDRAYAAAIDDLLDWMAGGPEPELGLTNMLKTADAIFAPYISALRGDWVEWPLIDGTTEWPVELLARRRPAVAAAKLQVSMARQQMHDKRSLGRPDSR